MRCPICNSKMKNGYCEYCNVTDTQVESSSFLAAKAAIKNKQKDKVVYTNVLPSDISRKKLWLFTFLLGYAGVGNFYTAKPVKAFIASIGMAVGIVFFTLWVLNDQYSWGADYFFNGFPLTFAAGATFGVYQWIVDMIALIFKKYKVPVILTEKPKFEIKRKKGE